MEYDLNGRPGVVAIDGFANVVGIGTTPFTNNQTRTTMFRTDRLVEWAEAVDDAYGPYVEVVFTPEKPMVATHQEGDGSIGVCVAPAKEVNDE